MASPTPYNDPQDISSTKLWNTLIKTSMQQDYTSECAVAKLKISRRRQFDSAKETEHESCLNTTSVWISRLTK